MEANAEHPKDRNRDPGVQLIVDVLDQLGWLVLYEWLVIVISKWWPRLRSGKIAYWYVIVWMGVLVALLLTTGSPAWLLIAAGAAAYRMFDLMRWYGDFLVNVRHNLVLSRERNFVFVIVNLVETTLICAIWLRAADASPTAGAAFYAAFGLVSQLDVPRAVGAGAKAAVAATEVMALTLLIGGLGILVAEIQEKIVSSGEWEGEPRRLEQLSRLRGRVVALWPFSH